METFGLIMCFVLAVTFQHLSNWVLRSDSDDETKALIFVVFQAISFAFFIWIYNSIN